jgi:hypothetical protein
MTSEYESYQVGPVEVGAEVVHADGRPLVELVKELAVPVAEAEAEAVVAAGAPADGWRVLHSREGYALIGAPTPEDRQVWRLAQISPAADGAQPLLQPHEEAVRLRPGRSERRRGLELRWPPGLTRPDSAALDADDDPAFAIDIVNVGDTTWKPDGVGFHAVGVVAASGATDFAFTSTSYGQGRAVALDPGEYARVPVTIDSGSWARLEPGRHDLHAVLVDLGLPAPSPLPIQVSAAWIARHRTPPRERHVDPGTRRRQQEQEIRRLSAQLAAAESLDPLIEALRPVTTRREALTTIAHLLECDLASAELIWMTSLGELMPLATPSLRTRLDELEARGD